QPRSIRRYSWRVIMTTQIQQAFETKAHQTFANAVAAQRKEKRPIVPHLVNGTKRFEGPLKEREDPSDVRNAASAYHDASEELVLEAIQASRDAQKQWRQVPLAK